MPELKIKTEYVNKLKKLGVYDKWFSNLKAQWTGDRSGNAATVEDLEAYSYNGNWSNLISRSFIFSNTPEKALFWSNIAKK